MSLKYIKDEDGYYVEYCKNIKTGQIVKFSMYYRFTYDKEKELYSPIPLRKLPQEYNKYIQNLEFAFFNIHFNRVFTFEEQLVFPEEIALNSRLTTPEELNEFKKNFNFLDDRLIFCDHANEIVEVINFYQNHCDS